MKNLQTLKELMQDYMEKKAEHDRLFELWEKDLENEEVEAASDKADEAYWAAARKAAGEVAKLIKQDERTALHMVIHKSDEIMALLDKIE